MLINGTEYKLKFNQLTLEKVSTLAVAGELSDTQALYAITQAAVESGAWLSGITAPSLEETADALDLLTKEEKAAILSQFFDMNAYKETLASQVPAAGENDKKKETRKAGK